MNLVLKSGLLGLSLHFLTLVLASPATGRASAMIGFLDFSAWLGHEFIPCYLWLKLFVKIQNVVELRDQVAPLSSAKLPGCHLSRNLRRCFCGAENESLFVMIQWPQGSSGWIGLCLDDYENDNLYRYNDVVSLGSLRHGGFNLDGE